MNTDNGKGITGGVEVTNLPERQEWVTPTVRRVRAGEAENGFTQAVEDGHFTGS